MRVMSGFEDLCFGHHHRHDSMHEGCCFNKCDSMCCNDPFCREHEEHHHHNRFVFCVCWDRLRRCWVNPCTGMCVDINNLRL